MQCLLFGDWDHGIDNWKKAKSCDKNSVQETEIGFFLR